MVIGDGRSGRGGWRARRWPPLVTVIRLCGAGWLDPSSTSRHRAVPRCCSSIVKAASLQFSLTLLPSVYVLISLPAATMRFQILALGLTADEVTAVQTAKEALQRELKLHNLEMQKVALVARAAESELDQYQQTTIRIENDAAAVREEIERLKTELGQERKVRRNREEYESLAKMANVRPARRVTEAKLAEV